MCEEGTGSILASWKGLEETSDSSYEKNREAEDGTQLDDDGEHLPEAIVEADTQQGLGYAEMCCGTDRQELGKALDDAEDHGKNIVVQMGMVAYSQWQLTHLGD